MDTWRKRFKRLKLAWDIRNIIIYTEDLNDSQRCRFSYELDMYCRKYLKKLKVSK